jgi:DNA-binding CsgD family transcriptional regulator
MSPSISAVSSTTAAPGDAGLRSIIDVMGSADFAPILRDYLEDLCGAEHFALYLMEDGAFTDIAAASPSTPVAARQARLYASGEFWRRDPGLASWWNGQLDHQPVMVRLDPEELECTELRDRIYRPYGVRERVLVSARGRCANIALSLIRTNRRGPFSDDNLAALAAVAGSLTSIALKHVSAQQGCSRIASALTSLPGIERCIARAASLLARREAEVCARILYGMTSPGIASDLGIGEESAMTYRKRAYHRLGISSQRELLLWYLEEWSRQKAHAPAVLPH